MVLDAAPIVLLWHTDSVYYLIKPAYQGFPLTHENIPPYRYVYVQE